MLDSSKVFEGSRKSSLHAAGLVSDRKDIGHETDNDEMSMKFEE